MTISSSIEPAMKHGCHRYIDLPDQPCLCLCFGFSQIIRILPFLLITLHFSQIGFTDERTFMGFLLPRCIETPACRGHAEILGAKAEYILLLSRDTTGIILQTLPQCKGAKTPLSGFIYLSR